MDLIDVELFKKQLNIHEIEIDYMTSAKTGEVVNKVFYEMGKRLINDK
jgi:hypothetical protein